MTFIKEEIEVDGPSRDEMLQEDTHNAYVKHLEEEVKFLRSMILEKRYGSIPRVIIDPEDFAKVKGHVPFGSARARIEALLAKPRSTKGTAPTEQEVKEEMEKEAEVETKGTI